MFPDLAVTLAGIADYFDIPLIVSCNATETLHNFLGFESIRNVPLIPHQIAGILIGIIGAIRTFRHSESAAWFYAMLFFACMNISSLFCHNIYERKSVEWEFARLLDLVFTGSSALSLWYTRLIVPSHMFSGTFLLLLGYNAKYSFLTRPLSWLPELTYIGTMLIALFALGRRLTTIGDSKIGVFLSIAGISTILSSLPLDSYFCQFFGSNFSSVHAMFMGSNLSMLGLLVLTLSSEKQKKIKTE
jgi:hypothetical protein